VNNVVQSVRDTKCSSRTEVESTKEIKEKGKDRVNAYKKEDNDDIKACSCGFMKLFRGFFFWKVKEVSVCCYFSKFYKIITEMEMVQ